MIACRAQWLQAHIIPLVSALWSSDACAAPAQQAIDRPSGSPVPGPAPRCQALFAPAPAGTLTAHYSGPACPLPASSICTSTPSSRWRIPPSVCPRNRIRLTRKRPSRPTC
ncbi:hypothetical protein XFF6990_200165 [Xanthomonas citri pv. fuscans]|uniref:Secreted protein n=1 Tax=Xanthomonas campestris pv. phaseoli TaxID=317013 RepID=A0A7Z7NIM1_XANCH|nr:hypothetical protein XFF6990_200165 [Xanthomonas citri pv. fuscans]SOO25415.1 hypothetical protein XFF6991_450091 [Xanthomonas phaseoli pv. phaseoli]